MDAKTIREFKAKYGHNQVLARQDWDAAQERIAVLEKKGKDLTPAEVKELSFNLDLVEFLSQPVGRVSDPGQPGEGTYTQSREDFLPRQGYTSYRELFGDNLSNDGFSSFGEFFRATMSGGDRRLQWMAADGQAIIVPTSGRAAMAEVPPSLGGFMVPTEFSAQILDVGLESSIVMPRASVWPMQSATLKVPGWEIGSHASNVYGGIICYWESEGSSITETEPKTRMIELNAHKLSAYSLASNELRADAPNFEERLMGAIGSALAWYLDRAMIDSGSTGDGAGKCQSFLNSPAKIEVDKETGQVADSILYENLINILARLYPPSFQRAVWIANNDTLPELMKLTVPVGTGGAHVRVLNENSGSFSIFGRPLLFTEKCPALGNAGDISLVDLSQYVVGLRGKLAIAVSPHVKFQEDQIAVRAIMRVDAQGAWDEALTPAEATDTLSPFVCIAERA